MKISIIGSFRKYYDSIKQIILLLRKNGIEVLSPQGTEIMNSVDDFVIFESDDCKLVPYQIQTITLNRILKSDAVYVYNPEGYVGRTTCYEIGVLRTTTIPLIFFERPRDLPIQVPQNVIMNPSKLVYTLQNNMKVAEEANQIVLEKYKLKSEMRLKNIVICGSMCFYDKMLEVSEILKAKGIPTLIPKEETVEKANLSVDEFANFKRKVSNQYLSKIRENTTYAILALNQRKNEIDNYIGANTLVEISMAFCWGRPIFLYNDFYTPLVDELTAWGAICLQGDLDKLIQHYKEERYSLNDQDFFPIDDGQLELGDLDEYFYPLFR